MALADLTSADAVFRALEEFDRLGREEFLARHGFEKARRYFLVRNGQRYDSKRTTLRMLVAVGHTGDRFARRPFQWR